MLWDNPEKPLFGNLSDVKVVHSSVAAAGPVAAQLLADHGADCIWIENSAVPDVWRFANGRQFERERVNCRNIALNIPSEEGRKVFLEIIKDADIFIEASKGGQYEKWGLTDEVMWEVNPRLVILHISGFGQTGLERYVRLSSYDPIGQAFGGYTFANRNPHSAPFAAPFSADYITALFGCISALTALHNARRTGKGESIDLAQYEAVMRVLLYFADYATCDNLVPGSGYPSIYGATGAFECADGDYVFIQLMGKGNIQKCCELVGFDYAVFQEKSDNDSIVLSNTEIGKMLTEAVEAYFKATPSGEAEEAMQKLGIPATKINSYKDLMEHPHVQAREMVAEWENVKGAKITAAGIVPKFKNNPGQIWGPCPAFGQHTDSILKEIGYSDEKIAELYEQKVVAADKELKMSWAPAK